MAANQAEKSTMQHRHGCVIVYNNKEIVAKGHNHMRCTMENVFSVHAEVEAVNKLRQVMKTKSKDFVNKCTLYVVRIGKNSDNMSLKMSQPCERCAQAIRSIGIPTVVYSVADE